MLTADRWITPYNLHPLSFFTLAYIAGILAQAYEGCLVTFLSLVIISLVTWQSLDAQNTPIVSCKKSKVSHAMVIGAGCTLFFTGGMARFFYEKISYDALFARQSSDRYTCTGRVCDIAAYTHPYFKKRITLAIDSLTCTTDPTFIYQKSAFIYVYVPAHENCQIDDEITIHQIVLKKPKTFSDFIRTMRSTVIALIFDSGTRYTIKKAANYSWRHYFFDIRSQTASAVCQKLEKSLQPLYTALFLGNKTDLPITPYTASRFSLWGISHHLARSGLHLVIVVWLWLLFLQRLPISDTSKYGMLAFLGVIYYLLSWSSISFDRACLSFFLYKICSYRRTPLDPMHAISLVLLAFLLTCPAHLLCLDFQLSFGLTYALAWFNHAHTKLNREIVSKRPLAIHNRISP